MSYWDIYIIFGIIFVLTSIGFFVVSKPLKSLFEAELIQHRVIATSKKNSEQNQMSVFEKIGKFFSTKK